MADKAESKPSLAETISSFSPWGSRSTTPRPNTGHESDKGKDAADKTGGNLISMGGIGGSDTAVAGTQRGGDHSISHWHRLSSRAYPKDCPKLNVQWFHAVDVALRKPNYGGGGTNEGKPSPAPKKWAAFSANDSISIEIAFQQLSEEEEKSGRALLDDLSDFPATKDSTKDGTNDDLPNRAFQAAGDDYFPKVPVNEDYLFDVDIKNRELGPAYWLGPVYSVRRGTWFYVDGTTLKPCDENLSLQLEEGYIKTKPWRLSKPSQQRSSSQLRETVEAASAPLQGDPERAAADILKSAPQTSAAPPTHRLFGSHMNNVVAYEDETTAWLLSDDFLSRMSSSMYQRFAGGAHLSGTKVLRGMQILTKKRGAKDIARPTTPTKMSGAETSKPAEGASITTTPAGPSVATSQSLEGGTSTPKYEESAGVEESESQVQFLERQMSNLVAYQQDPGKQDEEMRKREEKEIRDDYKEMPGDAQDREIEHLVLVTHGIGQRLGARFETFNFIHDVNELRKTLKSVYSMSPDLQALNGEIEKLPKNCRVQVLPICWRHLLDFPQQSLKHNRREFDLGEAATEDEEAYPSLQDITIDGVPALRNIVADLALDVLLYQAAAYHEHISRVVAKECNRILDLFKRRNPSFDGKISLIGHSLGSAVFFDLLSTQAPEKPAFETSQRISSKQDGDTMLDFNVENLVCFGSPIGLFQMLNGKTISGRSNPNQVTLDGSEEGISDPFDEMNAISTVSSKTQKERRRDVFTSSPKCKQLYNIFHPSDPISYRLEPLISPSMSALQPQNLPYTKKSFLGAPMGHGITGIPARVGQSVSGLWSSFSSGIANNFINRSLGISAEDAIKMGASLPVPHSRGNSLSQSVGAGTNITSGGVISADGRPGGSKPMGLEIERKRKLTLDAAEARRYGEHPPTLIDAEMETLYSGFQKRRKSEQSNDASSKDPAEGLTWMEIEERGRKLKREEAKVRMLNSNGRVDYSIQEGAFDISFLQSIASHLTYWTDEDVCHFLISQLLSRQRVVGVAASESQTD